MIPKKLDKRNKGYGSFKYLIEFNTRAVEKFCQIRNWCWEQWGPSSELEFYHKLSNPNICWSWLTDEWRMNVYIATDKEYQWFLLKWHD